MKAIRNMHRLQEFDLIHAHGALPCGHAAMLIGRELRIPFAVSVHGLDAFQDEFARTRVYGAWCRRISAEVYRSAAKVICISERVCERLGPELRGSTEVIYNGVDADLFCPGQELEPGLTVLSVGNLIPIKGHALLLRAFARISADFPEGSLEIFGDGPERLNLLGLARQLGISGRVSFQGRQSRGKIAKAMQRCAVFALPSSYEGLGCVYLEAMASGKPAIGCREQGIEEIIEHGKNGFLISPGNEAELSECLRMLLQNQDFRSRVGTSARSTILQRHTLGQQARELTDLYRECVR
jgi:glycosyltransferase involved in cell wall biosynthesis